jgi:hypothetical protein
MFGERRDDFFMSRVAHFKRLLAAATTAQHRRPDAGRAARCHRDARGRSRTARTVC